MISSVMDDHRRQSLFVAVLGRLTALSLLTTVSMISSGCDTIASDFQDLADQISPPSPQEAAQWATDFSAPEAQQKGIMLIGNAPWGGSDEYLRLYRTCIEGPFDPLVKAAAIRALGYHGEPSDAQLLANQLEHEVSYVRLEAAKALQRIHDEKVADALWERLVNEEEASVRIELAIALGQYPRDSVFQALVLSLESRELAVNLAAADSLRTLTGQDYGLDSRRWLAWYKAASEPFKYEEVYLYPVYTRPLGFFDYINIFNPTVWQKPGVPRGLDETGMRSTWAEGPAQTQEGS